ncbi:GNAT family N-acetyltransferase [Acidobacteria bacterium AH-259-D05]|nr:GNAT family N-acetyltransferase [Acidobacteria bacterium AH-259-D05]
MEKVRSYRPEGDFDQVNAIQEHVLRCRGQFRRFHEWLYELNPARDRHKSTEWVYEDEAIVGFVSGMPCDMKVRDGRVRVLWAQNFGVDAEYQGRGVGKLLFRQLLQDGDVVLAIGCSKQSHALFLQEGCRDVYADYLGSYPLGMARLRQLASALLRMNAKRARGLLVGGERRAVRASRVSPSKRRPTSMSDSTFCGCGRQEISRS